MDLYYEVVNTGDKRGYIIKDRDDIFSSLFQYENEKTGEDYIKFRTDKSDKDYRKYAQMHIDFIKKEIEDAEKEKVSVETLNEKILLMEAVLDDLMFSNAEVASVSVLALSLSGISQISEYIASRIIFIGDRDGEQAGKDYYYNFMSTTRYAKYKTEVDKILTDAGKQAYIKTA